MSSDKRYTLQQISDLLAAKENISKKKADLFVRTLFEVVQASLEEDRFVKIKGFGTFKLVAVNARESVNVNTGERFQISSHNKVSFTPDNALRDMINRPFADFETIILEESTNLEELENVTNESLGIVETESENEVETTTAEEKAQDGVVTTSSVEEDNILLHYNVSETKETEVYEIPADVEEAPTISALTSPLSPEEKVAVEEEPNSSSVSETAISSSAPAESKDLSIPTPPPYIPKEKEEMKQEIPDVMPSHIAEEPAEEHTEKPSKAVLTEQQRSTLSARTRLASDSTPEQLLSVTEEERFEYSYAASNGSSVNYRKYLSFLLLALLAIVLSAVIGYNYGKTTALRQNAENKVTTAKRSVSPSPASRTTIATPKKEKVAPTVPTAAPVPATKIPSTAVTPTSEKSAVPAPSAPAKLSPDAAYNIVGTLSTHKMAPGESITKIAQATYGDKSFVKYIIAYNEFKNPDVVPVGTVIKLPKLQKKG